MTLQSRLLSYRTFWLGLVAVAVAVFSLAGIVHTPPVRTAVLRVVTQRLRGIGVELEAARFQYNLIMLSATIEGVEMAATATPDDPFFAAERVTVDLPWRSVLRGTLVLQSLETFNPRITVHKRHDGLFNLPSLPLGDDSLDTAPGPFIVGRLVVRNLDARYTDDPGAIDLLLAGFTVELAPQPQVHGVVSGRFAATDGMSIRVGGRTTTIGALAGALAFDGATVLADDVVLVAQEGKLLVKGRADLLATHPAIDLTFAGEVSLDDAARWMPTESAPRGRLTLDGRVSGPFNDPQIALQLEGTGLAWRAMNDVSLRASGVGSSSEVAVDRLTLQAAGGSLAGRGALRFDPDSRVRSGEASLEWRDFETAFLLSSFVKDPPVRVASRTQGTLVAALAGSGLDTLTAKVVLISHGVAAVRAVPLSGRAELGITGGAWTLTHDHRVGSIQLAGFSSGRLEARELTASTLQGRATVTARDLVQAAQDLGRAGLKLPAGFTDALGGRLTANATLGGTLGAPLAAVALDAAELSVGPVGPGVLNARAKLTPDHGQVTGVDLAIGPNRAHGTATVRWGNGALDGRVTADVPDLRRLTLGLPARWQAAGSLTIEASVAGTTDQPDLTGTVEGSGLTVAGQQVDRVMSTFGLMGRVAVIEELMLMQSEGHFVGSGRYDLSNGGYALQAAAENWEVRPIPAAAVNQPAASLGSTNGGELDGIPMAGRFDLRVDGSGTIDAPVAEADVTFARMRYGDYSIGDGRLDVRIGDGRAALAGRLEDLLTRFEGTIALQSPRTFSGTVHVDRAELTRLAAAASSQEAGSPFLSAALGGRLTLSADLAGELDRLENTNADLRIELVDAAINGSPLTLVRPARLQLRRQDLWADDVEVQFGDTRVTLAGRLGQGVPGSEIRAAIDGRVRDLLDLVRLVTPGTEIGADGSVAAHVAATGSLTTPVVTAGISVALETLSYRDLPPATDVAVDATYGDGLLQLTRADGRWQGASVSATADVPAEMFSAYLPASYVRSLPAIDAPARLSARVESITRAALSPFVDAETLAQVDAQISGNLDVKAAALRAAAVEGRFELDRADLVLARVPLGQLEPTRLTIANGRLGVDVFRWGGAGNQLTLAGGLELGAEHPMFDLDLNGVLDLRMLGAFLPDVATDGTARVQLTVRGTTVEPDINGQVALEGVNLTLRDPRVAISNLSGAIRVDGDRMTASGISGSANGGTIAFGGELTYPGLALGDGTITLTGRGLAIALANGAQAELDADLALSISGADDPLLKGRITVLRGAYREPLSLADLALGADSVLVETAGLDEKTFIDRIGLDVAVVTADDLRVDNNYGRAELGASVRVLGTIGQTGLSGRATIREGGQLFLGGNTYVIEQSTIDFADPTRIEPELNLRARTRIGSYGITLGVSGTLDALKHDLQSDPPLSESDIVSVLVTGRTLSEAGNAQTEVASEQVLGYLSGDLLGFAGRALGLDTVRFERGLSQDTLPTDLALFAGDEDPASRLTISKNVRRNVEIVLSQNLRQSGGLTWIAMYRPLPAIELRTISRDDNTDAYEFRHTVQFGGGVRSRLTRTADLSGTPRIAAIRFAGHLGITEDTLRSHVALDAGDRFDFFAWQRGRDKLLSVYHERDFLEARIAATRETATGGSGQETVLLTYTVEPGPRTILRVDGCALPGWLRDDMRETWTRAVFDGFLLDDFRDSIRRHLAVEGYLRPSIETEIVRPNENEKEIVIRLDAGVPTTDRKIDLVGNAVVPADRLLTTLARLNVGEAAWIEPSTVAAGLQSFYRSEGFLTALVRVEPPVFEGSRARLPVMITEGPRFTLTRVAIKGAEARDQASVRASAALPEGATYSAAETDAARRRVEREYRRLGFNSVTTKATASIDAASASVTVTLAIAEGPRQVLENILVTGADVTRPNVVASNLALETGAAVDLAAWYRARKRLYDTNVFRSVDLEVEPLGEPPASGNDQPVRARVTLEEWPRYRFRYGFQLNDEPSPVAERRRELSPGLVADIQDRNLFGRASATGLAVRLQDDFRIARGFLSVPTFFGLKIRSGVFFTRSRQDFNQRGILPFIEDTTGVSLEQRVRATSTFDVAYSYRLENKRTFDPDPNPFDPFPLDLRARIGRFSGSVVAERRDDPFDATRGWFHSSTIEYSPELFRSDLRFVKYLGQSYYFRPVGPASTPTVFASAARFGLGRGFGQDLIISEKFFAGGANSVRGYPEDSLGEVDVFGDPRGGNAFLVFNQEVRFPIFKWVRGVTFVDAGNVFPRVSDLSRAGLDLGAGLGLRVRTPFALVRVDFARALSLRAAERQNRWYFSIGQAF